MTKIPFTCHKERETNLLVIIHFDVLLAVDLSIFSNDSSRYVDIYLMRHKSGTFEKFKRFQNEVEIIVTRKLFSAIRLRKGIFELQV